MTLLTCLSCATSRAPEPTTIWQVPSDFRIVGYFPSWSGDPLSIRYEALTHINYAFALVDATGVYRPIDNLEKLKTIVRRVRGTGVKVLLSVGGWNDGDTSALGTISSDPQLTERFVGETLDLMANLHLDGVDLDWEYPNDATAAGYETLVQALAFGLHTRGASLSLAVSANDGNGRFVRDGAWRAADWINIMAYDDGWGQRAGVPHSSYAFTRAALDYWLDDRSVPRGKVVLGVPFYGRSLVDRHARTYRSLVEQYPRAQAADVAGGYAYNGPDTLRAKIVNQARVRAGGVMIWQLNQDARGPRSLLSLIFDTVKEPVE